eukprot:gene11095-2010_t
MSSDQLLPPSAGLLRLREEEAADAARAVDAERRRATELDDRLGAVSRGAEAAPGAHNSKEGASM